MITLITFEKFKFGQKNIIPFAGEVQISEKGEIQVESQEIADQLVQANCGWHYPAVEQSTTTTTIPATTTTTTAAETTTTTTVDEIQEQVVKDELNMQVGDEIADQTPSPEWIALNENNKAKLQEMVKDFPRSEWGRLNKDGLIDYILEKTK